MPRIYTKSVILKNVVNSNFARKEWCSSATPVYEVRCAMRHFNCLKWGNLQICNIQQYVNSRPSHFINTKHALVNTFNQLIFRSPESCLVSNMEFIYAIFSGPYVFWQGTDDHISAPTHSVEGTTLFMQCCHLVTLNDVRYPQKALCEIEILVRPSPIQIGITLNVVPYVSLACPISSSLLTMFDYNQSTATPVAFHSWSHLCIGIILGRFLCKRSSFKFVISHKNSTCIFLVLSVMNICTVSLCTRGHIFRIAIIVAIVF